MQNLKKTIDKVNAILAAGGLTLDELDELDAAIKNLSGRIDVLRADRIAQDVVEDDEFDFGECWIERPSSRSMGTFKVTAEFRGRKVSYEYFGGDNHYVHDSDSGMERLFIDGKEVLLRGVDFFELLDNEGLPDKWQHLSPEVIKSTFAKAFRANESSLEFTTGD